MRFLVLALVLPAAAAAQTGGVTLGDALAAASTQSPEVAMAGQQALAERAALRAASSAFEPQVYGSLSGGQVETPLSSLQRPSASVGTAGQGFQRYEVGVQQAFRSGLSVTPLLQMNRTAPEGGSALTETTAGLAVAYPVLGGRARNTARAGEDAAMRRVEAADFDRVRTTETAARTAAVAYWDYAGAVRVRDALVVSEERAVRLLAETEALVRADERPAADLIPLQADVARRRAARLAADQSVYDARQRLGLAMGATADAADALGPPTDPLPEVPESVSVDEAALVALALDRRADLRATALRVRALDRESAAAFADLRPSVDLVLDAGYTTLSEGSGGPHQFLPLGIGATRGGRLGVSLRVNRLGDGMTQAAAERRRADVARAEIALDDLRRRVRADIAGAVAGLRSGAAETAQTRAAVQLYEEAVENERHRLRLGMGTLFDVQNVEEYLANARTTAVQAEVRYAQALVRLHAAVGTLAPGAFDPTALRAVPAPRP